MKLKNPNNPNVALIPTRLAEGLNAYAATDGSGHWISHGDYMAWIQAKGEILPEKTDCEVDLDFEDTGKARICPECGRILIKYHVGHGLSFQVDHCPGCGGVWLEKNEWEALERKNLHDEIHRIFSAHWQKGILEENLKSRFTDIYTKRFGPEGYDKARDFRAWLDRQENRAEIIAYLEAADPYKL